MAEENKVKGFFKGIGKKIDDAQLEMKLKGEFKKNNKGFSLYKGAKVLEASSLGIAAEDHLIEGYVTAFIQDDINDEYMLEADADKKVYLIDRVEDTTVSIIYDGNQYERPAKKIFIGPEATKVNVVKVGDSFYLKKNKE